MQIWRQCRDYTFDPDVCRSSDGKNEQEHDEAKRLQVVGRHPIHTIQNCAQQFTLRRVEPGAQNIGDAAVVRRAESWNISKIVSTTTVLENFQMYIYRVKWFQFYYHHSKFAIKI